MERIYTEKNMFRNFQLSLLRSVGEDQKPFVCLLFFFPHGAVFLPE